MYIYIKIYEYVYVHVYYTYIYLYIYICIYTCMLNVYTHYIHACIYTYIYTHTHNCNSCVKRKRKGGENFKRVNGKVIKRLVDFEDTTLHCVFHVMNRTLKIYKSSCCMIIQALDGFQ